MWVMAVATIFADRRMFPEIRSTLLRMATVASVIRGLPHKLTIAGCSVRAVTAAAAHFAVENRVRIWLHCLRTLLLMTIKTHLGLGRRHQYRVFCGVARVTARTGNLLHIVFTAMPGNSQIILVTISAVAVLLEN